MLLNFSERAAELALVATADPYTTDAVAGCKVTEVIAQVLRKNSYRNGCHAGAGQ
jgi:hypothetical protein